MLQQCLDLISQERYEAAIECLQSYLEGEGAEWATLFTGLCYDGLNKFPEAIGWYNKAIKINPHGKNVPASFNKGVCYYKLKDYERAIVAFNEAVEASADQKYAEASYNKGRCHEELGQYRQAIAAHNAALEASEERKHSVASFCKGVCFDELEDYEQAITAFDEAIAATPNGEYPDAYNNKGTCFEHLGNYEEAIICFEKAIADSPDGHIPFAWVNKANAQFQLGDMASARQSFFIAIMQDSELKQAFQFISDYFTAKSEYTNRVKLFDIVFMRQLQTVNAATAKALTQAVQNFADETPTGLYTSLLLHPADLLGTGLGHTARLRQAYLMAAANKEPAWVFYIIEYLLDAMEGYTLDALDYYFYLTSAQQVAAPLKELERIAEEAGYTGLSFQPVDEYLHQLTTPLPTDGVETCLQNDTEKLLYHQHWLAQQPYTVATTRTELELRYLAAVLGTQAASNYQNTRFEVIALQDYLQKNMVVVEHVGTALQNLLRQATQAEMLQALQLLTEAEAADKLSAKDANLLKAFALFKYEKVRQHTIKDARKGGTDLLTNSLGSAAAGHVVGLFVPGYFLYSFAIGLVGTVVTNLLRQPPIDAIAFEWQHFVKLLEEGKDLRDEMGGDV
jgi:tetratricopeptide (TPR) repeat protein